MADVVDEGEGLDHVHVESELSGNGARDLGYLERVRQAIAEMIGVAAGKDLGLGLETAKGAGMNDAVAVALKVVAVGMLRLRMTASAGVSTLMANTRSSPSFDATIGGAPC